MSTLPVALIQLCSGEASAENLATAVTHIRAAAAGGAKLVALPENVGCMTTQPATRQAAALDAAGAPALPTLQALAKELGIVLVTGSFAVTSSTPGKYYNRCYVIGLDGALLAHYDKIHLFDVDLPTGEKIRESENFVAGDTAKVVTTPYGRLGLSICYDVRFPALYRALAQAGAEIIVVPSAFTVPTGTAHWHTLLRARAIETGAYVLAPAQAGQHAGGRATYGHSLVIDPWGAVVAELPAGVGVLPATLDLSKVAAARAAIPAWQHDAPFQLPV